MRKSNPKRHHPITASLLAGVLILPIILSLGGCAAVGFVMYVFTADTAIKAKYHLPEKARVLVMVDDPQTLLGANKMMHVAAAQADYLLVKNDAVLKKNMIDDSRLAVLAGRLGTEYASTSVTRIGKTLRADIVIYARVMSARLNYTASVYQPTAQVRVQVIDVDHNARLFPSPGPLAGGDFNYSPGYLMKIKMPRTSKNTTRYEANKIVMRNLSKRIGSDLARLFYDHGKRMLNEQQEN